MAFFMPTNVSNMNNPQLFLQRKKHLNKLMRLRIKVSKNIQIIRQLNILTTNLKYCIVHLNILILQDLKEKMNFIQMRMKVLTAPIKSKVKMLHYFIGLICLENQVFRLKKLKNRVFQIFKKLQMMRILASELT